MDNVFTNFTNFSIRVSLLSKDFREREIIFNRLRENAPDLYFTNSMRQKFISYLFWHYPMFYNYVSFYYTRIYEDKIRNLYFRLKYKMSLYFQGTLNLQLIVSETNLPHKRKMLHCTTIAQHIRAHLKMWHYLFVQHERILMGESP